MEMVKVAASSRSPSVAGAIAGIIREQGRVNVQAIGAGAVNQAVNAIAIARGYLELEDIHVACIPTFSEVTIDGRSRTAMRLVVETGFTADRMHQTTTTGGISRSSVSTSN